MNILQTDTGIFDISSPIKVAEYTATASTLLLVQLAASGLDGSGVNACLTRTIGATRYQSPVTSSAGSTPYLPSMTIPVSTGDVLGVWMEGQAADVAVSVRVEVWDAYAGSLAAELALTAKAGDPMTIARRLNEDGATLEDLLDELATAHGTGSWEGDPSLVTMLTDVLEDTSTTLPALIDALPDSQDIRDAGKLAPTAGDPAEGSIDAHLDDLISGLAVVQATVDQLDDFFIYTLTTDGTTPIRDALVQAFSDAAMTVIVDYGITDYYGKVRLALKSPGTYYLHRTKVGVTFTNPDTEVIP